MFELILRRYQNKSTLVTTNRPFAEWREVFPNAACVVSLVDRLVHNAEIISMAGTQSLCSTRACWSMPTPSAYIATQSTVARFGSRENCLVSSAAVSSAFRRDQRGLERQLQVYMSHSGLSRSYIWWS